jgi:hypothetical protein
MPNSLDEMKEYIEEVEIVKIWGDDGDGQMIFNVKDLVITCFLPGWSYEGWFKEVYPDGYNHYLVDHELKVDKNLEIDLSGQTKNIFLHIFGSHFKKLSKKERTIQIDRTRDGIALNIIRGEIVDILKKNIVIDCGCFVFRGLPGSKVKIGDYVEASGRLDAYKAETFLERRSQD